MSLENWYQVKGAANERWRLRPGASDLFSAEVDCFLFAPNRDKWTYTLWVRQECVRSGDWFKTRNEAMTHAEAIIALNEEC